MIETLNPQSDVLRIATGILAIAHLFLKHISLCLLFALQDTLKLRELLHKPDSAVTLEEMTYMLNWVHENRYRHMPLYTLQDID